MQRFFIKTASESNERQIVKGDGWRISVLTDRLLRVETGAFCDSATQSVWYRAWEQPDFRVSNENGKIIVFTEKAEFHFDTVKRKIVKIVLEDGRICKNFNRGNLRGTTRTLDMSDGKVRLGKGLVSVNGVTVFDDSDSMILEGDRILPRKKCRDLYYFAYADNYRECIRDLFNLTGFAPLIPRFAFGNWWSRYKAYTQKEYTDLMRKFMEKKIPVTVATIDMDWHWVDVISKFGKKAKAVSTDNFIDKFIYSKMPGWTGYSWNTELFPDYKGLLDWLNSNGFTVTLNLHPAQGVRFFEDRYEDVCKIVGIDPESKAPAKFSLANEKFLEAYFDVLHRPYQREGVRFWWIDWQQGKNSDVAGLDPLWALNHYHTLDQESEGKRALILSRYAGIGSHRYPLGFSGDSAMTWKTLDFQPYMTATATNVGYTWWSHDIGGHHMGYKDDELYLRWLQFGVFSPINRLHSTSNEFMGKEPWKTRKEVEKTAEKYLRLRHKLIPYVYSINYLTHTEGRAICEPMYYGYKDKEAYEVPNQYAFGTQLVVAPITKKTDKRTNLASTRLWVPDGEVYTDIFTGRIYGSGKYEIYRDREDIPVFAKRGSIIPMYKNCETNDISLDQPMEIWLYHGNGSFTLYEDDGDSLEYRKGKRCFTDIAICRDSDTVTITMDSRGDKSVLPSNRHFTLVFKDFKGGFAEVNGIRVADDVNDLTLVYDGERKEIVIGNCSYTQNPDYKDSLIDLVSKFQMKNDLKKRIFGKLLSDEKKIPLFCRKCFTGPIRELQKTSNKN